LDFSFFSFFHFSFKNLQNLSKSPDLTVVVELQKLIRDTAFCKDNGAFSVYFCVSLADLNPERESKFSSSQLSVSADLEDVQAIALNGSRFAGCMSISWPNRAKPNVSINSNEASGTTTLLGDGRLSSAEVAAMSAVNSLEYCWVIHHHSTSFYPGCWFQPIKLLTEFCQTEDYKSRLSVSVPTNSPDDTPSSFHGNSVNCVVRSRLPASMQLKCCAPHLHRWKPCASSEFTDYFHDRIKVLSTGNTIYRYYILQSHIVKEQ